MLKYWPNSIDIFVRIVLNWAWLQSYLYITNQECQNWTMPHDLVIMINYTIMQTCNKQFLKKIINRLIIETALLDMMKEQGPSAIRSSFDAIPPSKNVVVTITLIKHCLLWNVFWTLCFRNFTPIIISKIKSYKLHLIELH